MTMHTNPQPSKTAHRSEGGRPSHRGLVTLVILGLLAGCASGPPSPRKLIYQAKKAYQAGDYRGTMVCMEKVLDTAPHVLQRSQFADEIQLYNDAQIKHGMAWAQTLEQSGQLIDAWIIYAQVAVVRPEREECRKAAIEALRLQKLIADRFLQEAQSALRAGDRHGALMAASQSFWYGGGDPAMEVFRSAAGSHDGVPAAPSTQVLRRAEVTDLLRTDSLDRFRGDPEFAPYGIPVFFGETPRYYETLGEITIEGRHFSQKIPAEYAVTDALSKLCFLARREGADALINVRLWTKRRKAFTVGEMVRFAALPPETPGASKTVVTRLGDGGPSIPALEEAWREEEAPMLLAQAEPPVAPSGDAPAISPTPDTAAATDGPAPDGPTQDETTAAEAAPTTEDTGTPAASPPDVPPAPETGAPAMPLASDEPPDAPATSEPSNDENPKPAPTGLSISRLRLDETYREGSSLTYEMGQGPAEWTYRWLVNGQTVAESKGTAKLFHTFTEIGPCTIQLIAEDGDGNRIGSAESQTRIEPVDALPYAVWAGFEFTIDTLPEGYQEYQWAIDGTDVGRERVLHHTFDAPGTHRIDGYARKPISNEPDAGTYQHVVYATTVAEYGGSTALEKGSAGP